MLEDEGIGLGFGGNGGCIVRFGKNFDFIVFLIWLWIIVYSREYGLILGEWSGVI